MRDYIHVADLAEAHVLALGYLRDQKKSLVANCGYGRGFSVLDVLKTVERVGGKALPVTYGPRRIGDAEAIVARVDKINAHLDWHPAWADLDTIVGHALAWEETLMRRNRV